MRVRRIKVLKKDAIYHCMTRCVNGEFLIGSDLCKEILRKGIWKAADFSGLEVLTYCVMSNHFHVLVKVPFVERVSDKELLRRYKVLYPKPTRYQMATIEVMEANLKQGGEEAEAIRQKLLARMHDVSAFMKLVKQRYSVWYNKTYERYGTLWADRFKSVLVQDSGNTLPIMSAYIDLNPVRAQVVEDAKDYRFCAYGEAVAGNERAVSGLRRVMGSGSEKFLSDYRVLMHAKDSRKEPEVYEKYLAELRRGGRLSVAEVLRVRVRYFTDGCVLGSQAYVEEQFREFRDCFGKKRRTGARRMRGSVWGGLHVMRDLRREVFG